MAEEPVEIDINLRQNVDTEADKASEAIARLTAESNRAQENASRMIIVQRDVVARLKTEIESLQKSFSNISVDTGDEKAVKWRQETYQQIRSLNIELTKQEGILSELETRNSALGETKAKLIGEIEGVGTAMKNLTALGRNESEQYKELEAQLGTLADAYLSVQDEQDKIVEARVNLESFSDSLNGVSDSIQNGVKEFGTASDKTSEFTDSLEAVGKAQAVVEAGQKTVNDTVKETAQATRSASQETQRWSALNQILAKTFNISNAAAQRLISTLSLGLGVAISFVTKLIQKQIEKWQETKRELEEYNKATASNAASQTANYEKLRSSYNKLGDDVKSKEKFIRDNQTAFNQLGVAINDVNSADNLFISQTEAFKSAIEQRARAAAAMDMATEKYKSAMQKQSQADEREKNPNAWEQLSTVSDFYDRDGKQVLRNKGAVSSADKIREQARKEEQAANDYVNQSVSSQKKAAEQLKNANIDAANELKEGTRVWWKWQKEIAQSRLDALKDTDKNSAEWNKLSDEILTADKMIKTFDITGSDKKSSTVAKKKETAEQKLQKMEVDIQKEINASVVAAMQEGRDKKLAELEADYNARKALIQQRQSEIEQLEKDTGVDGSTQKAALDKLSESETKKYNAQIKVITDGSQKALSEIWNEVNSRFRTETQNRLNEIDLFYKEQIKKAKENGATQEQLDNLSVSHTRDIALENQQIALETLEFASQVDIRRAHIQDKRVLFETDREEKILKIQLDSAKKRLAKLEDLQSSGVDSGKDIEVAKVEIEGLNAELNKMPSKKIAEVADKLQQAFSGVGDFASVFDEDLGTLFDMASSAAGGIADIASGNYIQGAQKLLSTVGKIINANKQANEEIRKFNLDLAQQAIDYSLAVIRAIKDVKSETDSIFIDDSTNTLTQGMSGYNAAIEKQSELMNQLGDATVKTGVKKKKFLGITYGTKDVYSNLLKSYPKLIDKDGALNRELAETLQASGNLNGETQKLIDNILQAQDAANEAMQAVESKLQSLVGSIGTQLKDVFDDAFASGTDSAKAMRNNVIDMLKSINTQNLFNAVFGSLFANLEGRMKESYGEGGDRNISDDLEWFMGEYPELVGDYNKGLQELQKAIKEQYGVDAFEAESTRTAVNKGIAQASQDSFDEFSGRMTFLVMKVSGIGTINTSILDTNREQYAIMQAMLSHLETISENSEFLRNLKNIKEDIAKMREGIILKR